MEDLIHEFSINMRLLWRNSPNLQYFLINNKVDWAAPKNLLSTYGLLAEAWVASLKQAEQIRENSKNDFFNELPEYIRHARFKLAMKLIDDYKNLKRRMV